MVLFENGLKSELVLLMKPIYIEKWHIGIETSGLNSIGGLNSLIFIIHILTIFTVNIYFFTAVKYRLFSVFSLVSC